MSEFKTIQWQQAQDLFSRALEVPEDERSIFLDKNCKGDLHLRDEVASLLKSFKPGEADLEVSPIDLSHGIESPFIPGNAVPGYEVLSEIHRGGQGVVYRAIQLGTRREVALKFLLTGPFAGNEPRRRFQREVEVVSKLRHPGIVPVFDSGITQGQPYYVMELVAGLRLQDYRAANLLSVRDLLQLMVEICDAVGFAHQQGVVHRDLKPSNIVVTDAGEPRVLDFGLAKPHDADAETIPLSMSGQIMGTLKYMSPEHAAGRRTDIDARSDVYSLGIILYEMLTGRLPYALDQGIAHNLISIQTEEPEPISRLAPDVHSEIVTIVGKALSKDQSRRYVNANALGADIRRHLSGEAIEAKSDSALYVLRKKARRYALQAGIAIALLVGISMGLWFAEIGAGPPVVAGKLEPLAAGDQYSQLDFESQLDALRDLIRQGTESSVVLTEFENRFHNLETSDFSDTLTPERQADLTLMLQVRDLLNTNPPATVIDDYRSRLETPPVNGRGPESGLARETAVTILEFASANAN